MNKSIALPQHSRLTALLLGLIGGALDVYSHIHFGSLVATQTGNLILLIADTERQPMDATILRCLSILCFSLGFLLGVFLKERAKTAYWRVYNLLPLLSVCFILPLLPYNKPLWVSLLAFSTGLLMLTFTGSHLDNHPYMILMTSGNYRKMLVAWYQFLTSPTEKTKFKRQAINYSFIVLSFVLGAVISVYLEKVLLEKSIWFVGACLVLLLWHYMSITLRYKLQNINID